MYLSLCFFHKNRDNVRLRENTLYAEQTHSVSSTPPNMFSVLQRGLAASRRQLVVEFLSVLRQCECALGYFVGSLRITIDCRYDFFITKQIPGRYRTTRTSTLYLQTTFSSTKQRFRCAPAPIYIPVPHPPTLCWVARSSSRGDPSRLTPTPC